MLPSEKTGTLLWALVMTAPAAFLVFGSMHPPSGLAGIGNPYWTITSALAGAMAGIGWITYDFRRMRQRRHLEAFWRAYRARFPGAPDEIPDGRTLARYIEQCPPLPPEQP
jgi:hypothetical protein